MRITIAQRFAPYTHQVGQMCLWPGQPVALCLYPAEITCYRLDQWPLQPCKTINLPVVGPVTKYAAHLDMERAALRLSGQSHNGYFCYLLQCNDGAITYQLERMSQGEKDRLADKNVVIQSLECMPVLPKERLALGCHKAQDWMAMQRRALLAEWLPAWHWMGQWHGCNVVIDAAWQTESSLLGALACAVQTGAAEEAAAYLKDLYAVSFNDFFVPAESLWRRLGALQPPTTQADPLAVLRSGASLIRALFLQYSDSTLQLLPCLPQELHAGRYLDGVCGSLATVDFEWSKHCLRRLIVRPLQAGPLTLRWPHPGKLCRLRMQHAEGCNAKDASSPYRNGQTIELAVGTTYYFDCFEK
jgi:hypothetical protein